MNSQAIVKKLQMTRKYLYLIYKWFIWRSIHRIGGDVRLYNLEEAILSSILAVQNNNKKQKNLDFKELRQKPLTL